MPQKVFISHSTTDRRVVETEIQPALIDLGLDCWYSQEQLAGDEDFQAEILSAIRQCEWFLIVLSPYAIQSRWVKAEVTLALRHCSQSVIPVIIQDCEVSHCHMQLENFDLIYWNRDPARALEKIRKRVSSGHSGNGQFPLGESTDPTERTIQKLRGIRANGSVEEISFVIACLSKEEPQIRDRARQVLLEAIGWKKAAAALANLPMAALPPEDIEGILNGLGALESHADVVELLDQLSNRLTGDARNRAILLWERKTLVLRREKIADLFRAHHSPLVLGKVLGQGLTAASILAEHPGLGKQLVVRMLRPELAARFNVRHDFLQLIQRASQIVHENLVMVRDSGHFPESQLYYYVRDYIPGATLQDVLNKGERFSPGQILSIIKQVALALKPIHEQGHCHQGIKPSNIFLTDNQKVILGDPSLPVSLLGHELQRLAFDFRYAAPEQFGSPASVGPAADYYSLGCLFYELACGQPPFVSDAPFELVLCHTTKPIPLASTQGSVLDPMADELIHWLLKRTPSERPQSTAEFLEALQALECNLDQRTKELDRGLIEAQTKDWRQYEQNFSIAEFHNPGDVYRSFSHDPRSAQQDGPKPVLQESRLKPTRVATLHQFFDYLQESELFSPEELHTLRQRMANYDLSQDAWPLAQQLIDQGRLTLYQANGLYQGYPDRLVLGNYVILDMIGRGGMGLVFKAFQRHLDREVALKILSGDFRQDTTAMGRFMREIKVLGTLQHPNIVSVYDAGESKGVFFLVMEYVPGKDLHHVIRDQGPFSVGQALDCVIQTAQGLDHAHQRNIIHRDVKPGNLLWDKSGTIKILDMGLAGLKNQIAQEQQQFQTMQGMLLGTVDFMAPEQAMDSTSADQRADIYSLGCTLFYLLTGKPVYEGGTMIEKLLANREAPVPSLLAARGDVPPKLETIFSKMLAKRPEDRYASMQEVIQVLSPMQQLDQTGNLKNPLRMREPIHDLSSNKDPQDQPKAWILYTRKGMKSRIDLETSPVTFGRSSQCDVELRYKHVSRVHFRIEQSGTGWVITDNNSANGTLVNGQLIEKSQPLRHRDSITIRNIPVQLEFYEPAAMSSSRAAIGASTLHDEFPDLDNGTTTQGLSTSFNQAISDESDLSDDE